jgi:hypothetical protein
MSVYGYRRGSIFWALTLIAVGVLFLYHNFNPALHPWQIIAKYWPIMIIFWGLSKLVDYLQATRHPETTPPPLFSASEVILLFLILVTGSLVSRVVLRPAHEWPAALGIDLGEDFPDIFLKSYSYTETLSQPAKPEIQLIVEDQRGDLEVRPGDQPVIEVLIKKEIKAENEEAAKKLSGELKVEIVEQAGAYVLRSNRSSLPGDGRFVRVDLVLRVPKGTSAEITSERGEVVVEGLQGNQTLTARRGDVRVANVEGLVRIHKSGGSTTVREIKGNVDVDGRGRDVEATGVTGTVTVNGEFSGSVQFANVGQTLRFNSTRTDMTAQKLTGKLNMELGSLEARGVEGPFEIATKQKEITVEDFRHSVRISTTNGDVRLETSVPPTQPVQVDVKKGEIELQLPSRSNFQIDASSRHGEVESDFSAPSLNVNKEGETPSITGSYGRGGANIRLTTTYGTIHLRRGGAQPSPAPEVAPGRQPRSAPPPGEPAPPPPPAPKHEEKSSSAESRAVHLVVTSGLDRSDTPWQQRLVRAVVQVNSCLVEKMCRPALGWMRKCCHKQIASLQAP